MNPTAISPAAHPTSLESATRVAVVGALSATTMLFASLVSAYLVRRSFEDWRPSLALWPLALLTFAVVVSAAMEVAFRSSGAARRHGFMALAVASGLYLAGALGVIVSTTFGKAGLAPPHRAFVVLLLSMHVVHALLGAWFSAWALRDAFGRGSESNLRLARLVTHFLTVLLLAILFLLFVFQ